MGLTRTRFSQANTAVARIQDPITVLNNESTIANIDVGFLINRNQGIKSNVAWFWSEGNNEFRSGFSSNTGVVDANIVVSSYANLRVGTLYGNIGGASDNANVYVSGSIIPTANVSYDLGNDNLRFRDLWLSGTTLHIGNQRLTVTNNQWQFTTPTSTVILGVDSTVGNLTVTGNLNLQGPSTTFDSNNLSLQDSIIELHTQANLAPLTGDDGRDIGIKFHYYKTQDEHAFLGLANDSGYLEWYDSGREGVGNIFTGNTYGTIKSGGLILTNNTPSTSTTTGVLKVTGGVGIQGNVHAGNITATNGSFGFISGTITSNSQPNITDVGTLVNLDVIGSSQLSGFTTFQGSGSQEYTIKIVGPDKDKLAISTGEDTAVGIGLYSLNNDESNYSNLRLQARSIDFRTGSTASNHNSKVRIDQVGNLLINTATTSTSTSTGALVVNGGVGIVGNVYANAVYTGTGLFWSGNSQAFESYGNVNLAAYLLTNSGNIASNFFLGGNVKAGNIEISGNVYGGIVPTAIFKDVYIGTTAVSLARGSQSLTVDNLNTTGYAAQANLAALATNATKTTVTSNISSGTAYISFVSATAGNVNQNVNTGLTYDPNSGNLRTYAAFVDTDLTIGGNLTVQNISFTNQEIITTTEITQGNLVANSGVESVSNITGALVVRGGIGASGNVFANVFYTTNGIRWAGNGAVFASGGGGGGAGLTYTAATTPPTTGNISGDQWYNTSADILYEYVNDGATSYWIDVQSLGQTGNITTISDATLQGNIIVGLSNVYSIGSSTGLLNNLFVSNITVARNITTGNLTSNANITAGNLTTTSNIVTNRLTTTTGVFWANGSSFGSGGTNTATVNALIWAQKIFWG